MEKIELKIIDTHGISHTYAYPWDSDEVYQAASRGVGRALVIGLLENGPLDLHVTELLTNLTFLSAVIKIKQSGNKVVYSTTSIGAVKLLFGNNLQTALTELVSTENNERNSNSEKQVVNWHNILELMLINQRLKSLGGNFYADTVRA
ncbi:LtrC-like protein [Weissella oryzae SG25]|uniref:LtrC-like protein n=1 Tax=Weissella oryzae (strain DSM 25784 / JCM 18191 / LMG 30913 / SG25) TaxID=1329250 RepID=A0A069CTT2_WEIOS|nr:hypothetical protein [Weissella oryzae]GAK30772.1 LtrC-like protein [Weissella oryzae SG25]